MAWIVKYEPRALRQLKKLDRKTSDRITRKLEVEIASQPNPKRMGTMLVADLQGYWRFRVGDYRVICDVRESELVILAIAIGHRKEVYQ